MSEHEQEKESISERLDVAESRLAESTRAQAPQQRWDGVERRTDQAVTDKLIEAINGRQQVGPQQMIMAVCSIGAILALQVLILISQFRMADRLQDYEARDRKFRESVSCFIVSIYSPESQGNPGAAVADKNLLTRCGFVTVPGNR